jgi:hypothetical protein
MNASAQPRYEGTAVSLRVPAFESTFCPKCDTGNTERKFYVWKVADERGLHFECDVCAHAWPFDGETINPPRRWTV